MATLVEELTKSDSWRNFDEEAQEDQEHREDLGSQEGEESLECPSSTTSCTPSHDQGPSPSVTELKGCTKDRLYTFAIDVDGTSAVSLSSAQNSLDDTRSLFMDLLLALTKNVLHWAGSDHVTVDPAMWQKRVLKVDDKRERRALGNAQGDEDECLAPTPGWLGKKVRGVYNRAAAVVVDGLTFIPSSWRCLIRFSRLVFKSSMIILETRLAKSNNESSEHSGHHLGPIDESELHELHNTTLGVLLPALVNGLLPLAHRPAFARSLVGTVTSALEILDRTCRRCSALRQADARYVATRNGRQVREEPQV